MSTRRYSLDELKQKQLRNAERRAKLAEKEKRAAEKQRILDKKVAEMARTERDSYLRSLGLILEAAVPGIRDFTPEETEELLRSAFSPRNKEVRANE